ADEAVVAVLPVVPIQAVGLFCLFAVGRHVTTPYKRFLLTSPAPPGTRAACHGSSQRAGVPSSAKTAVWAPSGTSGPATRPRPQYHRAFRTGSAGIRAGSFLPRGRGRKSGNTPVLAASARARESLGFPCR